MIIIMRDEPSLMHELYYNIDIAKETMQTCISLLTTHALYNDKFRIKININFQDNIIGLVPWPSHFCTARCHDWEFNYILGAHKTMTAEVSRPLLISGTLVMMPAYSYIQPCGKLWSVLAQDYNIRASLFNNVISHSSRMPAGYKETDKPPPASDLPNGK